MNRTGRYGLALLTSALLVGCPDTGEVSPTQPINEITPTDTAGEAPTAPMATPTASLPPTATPTATAAPTASMAPPTEAPTPRPTAAPTPRPTAAPTQAPTPLPTEAPTPLPTEAPTEAPTPLPTEAPTPTVPPATPTATHPPPPTEAPATPTPTPATPTPTVTPATPTAATPTPATPTPATPTPATPSPTLPVDGDGDGSFAADDCDDTDPLIFPGAQERCDGEDDDCDGTVEHREERTVWQIGLFDGSHDEFFTTDQDYDYTCAFEVDETPEERFSGQNRSSNAATNDSRYPYSCADHTVTFTLYRPAERTRIDWARYGGEDQDLYMDGAYLGGAGQETTTDPHDVVTYVADAGDLAPGPHVFMVKALPRPAYADGYFFVDALRLTEQIWVGCSDQPPLME